VGPDGDQAGDAAALGDLHLAAGHLSSLQEPGAQRSCSCGRWRR
jgi:hypothetical protein